MTFDINSDLGEHESPARTRALMKLISSANIACGGHAGSAQTMEFCVKLAVEHGVKIGAHPGFAARSDFGRAARSVDRATLALLLLQQVGALQALAAAQGRKLHHIKLHGALYHAVESSSAIAKNYLEIVKRYWPGLTVIALAGGRVAGLAKRAGLEVWGEAFAERGYLNNGQLVPRGRKGSLITETGAVMERLHRLCLYGEVLSIHGKPVKVAARTICVHADSPDAVKIARILHRKLGDGPVSDLPPLV
jgi:UPF0271 protein